MGEEKFASLSSGLLARKGAAKPAMRRQGFNSNGSFHEDLGWNDMGFEAPRPIDDGDAFEASVPQIRRQLDQLAEDFEGRPEVHAAPEGVDEGDAGHEYRANGHDCGLTPIGAPIAAGPDDVGNAEYTGDIEDDFSAEAVFEPAPIEEQVKAPVTISEPVVAATVEETPKGVSQSVIRQAADTIPARAKAAFTLRLDRERHLKLRLASAIHNRSAQQLVTEALDAFLADMPELDALAKRASNDTTH